jgi:hypothetical protein
MTHGDGNAKPITKLIRKIQKESTLKFDKVTLCQFDGWKRVKTVATNACKEGPEQGV